MSGPDRKTCTCGAIILFGKHVVTGKKIPVDLSAGDAWKLGVRFHWDDTLGGWATCEDGEPGYISHFANCPDAKKHRTRDQLALVPDDRTDG